MEEILDAADEADVRFHIATGLPDLGEMPDPASNPKWTHDG